MIGYRARNCTKTHISFLKSFDPPSKRLTEQRERTWTRVSNKSFVSFHSLLIRRTLDDGKGVAVFPAREHWRASAIELGPRVSRLDLPLERGSRERRASRRELHWLSQILRFPQKLATPPPSPLGLARRRFYPSFDNHRHRRPPPPPLLPAFSASASAFVHTLPYPNSYPRKHGYVHPGPARNFSFYHIVLRFSRITSVRRSRLDRSLFFFLSLFFSFLFFSYATRSVKRSRDPSATIRPLSFSSFIPSPHPFHSLVPSLARFFMHRMLAVPPWNSFSSPKKKLRRIPRDIILVVIFRAIARPAPWNEPRVEYNRSYLIDTNWTKHRSLPKIDEESDQLVARCGYQATADNEIFFARGNPVDKKRK